MPANKPYIIGLTGGIGCGKSEAAACLEALGAYRIDADGISRKLTAQGGEALPAIRGQFGNEVFFPDGTLDRRRLGGIVFSSVQHRRMLEAIIHPIVQRTALAEIERVSAEGVPVVVLEVPLLFECGMDVLCDETWVVTASPETQLLRVMARGLSEQEARDRISSQMPAEEKAARATRIIDTDRPIERTHAELASLYQQTLKKLN